MILTAKELRGTVPARLPLGVKHRVMIEGEEFERVIPRGHKRKTSAAQRRRQKAYEERHPDRVKEMKRQSAKRRYWSQPEKFRAESRESMKRWQKKMRADPVLRAAYNVKQAAHRRARRKADPEFHARELAYKKAWRAKRKAEGKRNP